mmetsp:Transcript_10305/g.21185  ORF Transcript_10305/g.21185 Transcript_10305/m.21185 type:complete len:201 (-) Transcript_10305:477-1079(-)
MYSAMPGSNSTRLYASRRPIFSEVATESPSRCGAMPGVRRQCARAWEAITWATSGKDKSASSRSERVSTCSWQKSNDVTDAACLESIHMERSPKVDPGPRLRMRRCCPSSSCVVTSTLPLLSRNISLLYDPCAMITCSGMVGTGRRAILTMSCEMNISDAPLNSPLFSNAPGNIWEMTRACISEGRSSMNRFAKSAEGFE